MATLDRNAGLSSWLERFSLPGESGLYLMTGSNGSGKSRAATDLAARLTRAELVSAESLQRFYELELENDQANFQQGNETHTTVSELLGESARSHPLFAAFGLDGLDERGYRKLSTGEARKVLVLRALLQEPEVLLLDEPFDGLDKAARAELWNGIREAARSTPIVLVGAFSPEHFEAELRSDSAAPLFREVALFERGALIFCDDEAAWKARSGSAERQHRAPPVEHGKFYAHGASPYLIELRGGKVAYGDTVIFDGLDWAVRPGGHTLIEGPNGSGKSTLLAMVSGDHPQAYSNELYLFGRRRGTGESVWDIKKKVGIVSGQLHRDYRAASSVEEVLLSGLYDSIGLYQSPEPSERARARAWFEWLDVPFGIDTAFRELSFGLQRLVLVARAAIKVPPLLVLDEPTTGLDDDNRARVLTLLASLCRQEKSTVLFVTHRADERAFWDTQVGGAVLTLGSRLGIASVRKSAPARPQGSPS